MFYTDEQIKRANEHSISEYFKMAGYETKKIGSETHISGFGGFYVKDNVIPNQFYVHSKQMGGAGLISCLMKVMDMPFKDAVCAALDGEQGRGERATETKSFQEYRSISPVPEKKSQFLMPEKAADNKRVFSYLTKTRYVSPEVVNAFIKAGLLYQDTKGNAVYLHRNDGKPCGAEIHGTSGKRYNIGNTPYSSFSDKSVIPTEPYIAELLDRELKNTNIQYAGYVYEGNANIVAASNDNDLICGIMAEIKSRSIDRESIDREVSAKLKNYKGVAPGTSESYFNYDVGNPQKAYVFESSIDLMSFMTLHPEVSNAKFTAMAGLKPNVVEKLLASGMAVTLCVDNDEAGKNFVRQFAGRCKYFSECSQNGVKDFNELLKQKRTVPFGDTIGAMKSWADKAMQKINTPMRKAEYAR